MARTTCTICVFCRSTGHYWTVTRKWENRSQSAGVVAVVPGRFSEPLVPGPVLRVRSRLSQYATPIYTRNTLMASSPRWLITLTAIRPEVGLENVRETLRRSVAQAS